jgi:regulator of RNase E activity RraA
MSTNPLSSDVIAFLKSVDSPTLANAIEPFKVRDRTDGFIGGQIVCQFPELDFMVGRALTVTMSNAPGEVAGRDGYWQMWDALSAMDGPVVLAVQDVSGAPHRVAFAGEIMSTLAQKLGAVGMVTDGAFRDVKEVRALGFHYFMKYPVVSHSNFWIESVGDPIELDGQRVETGDILHGDANGIVIVPDEVLAGLPEAVAKVRSSEQSTMEYIRSADFDYTTFKTRSGY